MNNYNFFKVLNSTNEWSLTISSYLTKRLLGHLFPGDNDEHGAIIQAGISKSSKGLRLLARDVIVAQDGVEYLPGKYGYRMLSAEFITKQAILCRNEKLAYIAVHNHGGGDSVAFSKTDLASQQRGYPALLDVLRGQPVGALVFTQNAVAGRLWLSASVQINLSHASIVGSSIYKLYPSQPTTPSGYAKTYDRQARLFGDRGQDILSKLNVGIIGAGGVGSLLIEYLSRLGVGNFIVVDPERIDLTNVPRIPGSTRWDARSLLTKGNRPAWLKMIGERISAPKINVMKRIIHRANPKAKVVALKDDFVNDHIARKFKDCDYLFLAADSMQARLVFNALVYTYLIPGVQVGAKVQVNKETGKILDIFSVSRPITPVGGCLWCNELISPKGLQREAENKEERIAQRYVEDDNIKAPSVITLNSTAASQAANDFLFSVTGLRNIKAKTEYYRNRPMFRKVVFDEPRQDKKCPFCSVHIKSSFARGDTGNLFSRP